MGSRGVDGVRLRPRRGPTVAQDVVMEFGKDPKGHGDLPKFVAMSAKTTRRKAQGDTGRDRPGEDGDVSHVDGRLHWEGARPDGALRPSGQTPYRIGRHGTREGVLSLYRQKLLPKFWFGEQNVGNDNWEKPH